MQISLFLTHGSILKAISEYTETLIWAQTSRNYKEASLRDFVNQMSRWYGFTVKEINCIPIDRRISASVCYRDSPKEKSDSCYKERSSGQIRL